MIWILIAIYLVVGFISGRYAFVSTLGDAERTTKHKDIYGDYAVTKEYKDAVAAGWTYLALWPLAWLFTIGVWIFENGMFAPTKAEKKREAKAKAEAEATELAKLSKQIEDNQLKPDFVDQLIGFADSSKRHEELPSRIQFANAAQDELIKAYHERRKRDSIDWMKI